MKFIVLLVILCMGYTLKAQSDNDIVKMILGEKFVNVPNKLKENGVWYFYHFRNTQTVSGEDNKDKFFSIENGDKRTKVWILEYNKENIVTEVKINCRHDDRGQVEDIQKMKDFDGFHVGIYSTDVIYRWKK